MLFVKRTLLLFVIVIPLILFRFSMKQSLSVFCEAVLLSTQSTCGGRARVRHEHVLLPVTRVKNAAPTICHG